MIHKIVKEKNILSMTTVGVTLLIELCIVFIIAREYSKSDFGQWQFYITCVLTLESLRNGLLTTVLIRFLSAATSKKEREAIIGSAWFIGISFSLLISILSYSVLFLFPSTVSTLFIDLLRWYAPLSFTCLPVTIITATLQERGFFGKLFFYKLLFHGVFLVFVVFNYFKLSISIDSLIVINLLISAVTSFIGILTGESGIGFLFRAGKKTIIDMLNFGKYCMGTAIVSDFLKSSDILLITIILSKQDGAVYGIPMKIIGGFNIPILGLSLVAFPLVAKAASQENFKELSKLLYRYISIITLLFIPIIIGAFIFSKEIIVLVAGKEYQDSVAAVNVFRLFLFYALFLGVDRFTGIALDSLNMPHRTFKKVLFMLIANIIGDLIAIFFFRSLEAVACVTICVAVLGCIMGVFFLRGKIIFKLWDIPRESLLFIKELPEKIRSL